MGGPRYSVLIPPDTQSRAAAYLKALQAGQVQAGGYLRQQLATNDGLAGLSALDLLGRLCDSKRPQIFAETEVVGDGSDWSPLELSLLGDLSVSVPVMVFDDGHHTAPTPHTPPLRACWSSQRGPCCAMATATPRPTGQRWWGQTGRSPARAITPSIGAV